jgi:hypothetical protein
MRGSILALDHAQHAHYSQGTPLFAVRVDGVVGRRVDPFTGYITGYAFFKNQFLKTMYPESL